MLLGSYKIKGTGGPAGDIEDQPYLRTRAELQHRSTRYAGPVLANHVASCHFRPRPRCMRLDRLNVVLFGGDRSDVARQTRGFARPCFAAWDWDALSIVLSLAVLYYAIKLARGLS